MSVLSVLHVGRVGVVGLRPTTRFVGGICLLACALGCSRPPLTALRTGAMYPTLERTSHCVVVPIGDAPALERGHVVALARNGRVLVRRVAGIAGDVIEPDDGLYRRKGTPPKRSLNKPATMCLMGPSPRCTCEYWTETIGTRRVNIQRLSRSVTSTDIRCDAPMEREHPRVAEGHVFLLADNRDGAKDSRHFGAWPVSKILGRVLRCR